MSDPRPTAVRPGLWMRSGGPAVPALAAGLCLVLACAGVRAALAADASAEESRPVTLAFSGGYRIFNHQVDLKNEAAFGARLGLGIVPRLEVALDFELSDPLRGATGRPASISALRALVRVDALRGPTRPYAIAGVGGLLMNFDDSPDFSSGALTVGVGIEHGLGGGMFARLEGTADFYRAQVEKYDNGGTVVGTTGRTTNGLGTISLGLGTRF